MSRHLWTSLAVAIVGLCLAHTAARVVRDLRGAWPAERKLPRIDDSIATAVRGIPELGLVRPESEAGEAPGDTELFLYRVQHVIAPTYLVPGKRDVTLVLFGPDEDAGLVRNELEREGYGYYASDDAARYALLSKQAWVRSPPTRGPSGLRTGLLWVLLILPLIVSLRRGALSVAFTAVGVPGVLAAASAVGDATPAPLVVLLMLYVAGMAGWIALAPKDLDVTRVPRPKSALYPWIFGALAVLGLVALVIQLGLRPEGSWDAQAMYNMRARFIGLSESFWAPFADVEGFRQLHSDYPPLIPFAVAGSARLAGGFGPLVSIPTQLLLWLGFSIGAVEFALRRAGRVWALAALALCALSPFFLEVVSDQGTDLVAGTLLAVALASYAALWTTRSKGWAWRTGLLLGLCLWSKNEGLMYVLLLCGLIVFDRLRGTRLPLRELFLGLLPFVLLYVFFKSRVPQNDLVETFDASRASLARAREILEHFAALLLEPARYKGLFLWALPLALLRLVAPQLFGQEGRHPLTARALLVIAFAFGVFFAIYLVTPSDLTWHLRTSASRVIAQLYPLAVLLGVSVFVPGVDQSSDSTP